MRPKLASVLLCGLLGAASCEREDNAPLTAARQFAAAIQRGDVRGVIERMEGQAVERLDAAAERAGDQVGGRRSIEPDEMIQVVGVDPTFQLAQVSLLERDEMTARVRLRGADGSEHILNLILEGGVWKVRVPMPPIGSGMSAT